MTEHHHENSEADAPVLPLWEASLDGENVTIRWTDAMVGQTQQEKARNVANMVHDMAQQLTQGLVSEMTSGMVDPAVPAPAEDFSGQVRVICTGQMFGPDHIHTSVRTDTGAACPPMNMLQVRLTALQLLHQTVFNILSTPPNESDFSRG